mmetsp:Transcript_831/g.2749  ORF Transcript_831/g.2749 Transcript_831/m.2749 type:complete len:468 (+) Transcript_831:3-1406(+)
MSLQSGSVGKLDVKLALATQHTQQDTRTPHGIRARGSIAAAGRGLPQQRVLGHQLLAPRLDAVAVLPERQAVKGLLDARADVLQPVQEQRHHRGGGDGAERPQRGVERERQQVGPQPDAAAGEAGVAGVDGRAEDPLARAEHVVEAGNGAVDLVAVDRVEAEPPLRAWPPQLSRGELGELLQHVQRPVGRHARREQPLDVCGLGRVVAVPHRRELLAQRHPLELGDLRVGHRGSDVLQVGAEAVHLGRLTLHVTRHKLRPAAGGVDRDVVLEGARERHHELDRVRRRPRRRFVRRLRAGQRQDARGDGAALVVHGAPQDASLGVARVAVLDAEGEQHPQRHRGEGERLRVLQEDHLRRGEEVGAQNLVRLDEARLDARLELIGTNLAVAVDVERLQHALGGQVVVPRHRSGRAADLGHVRKQRAPKVGAGHHVPRPPRPHVPHVAVMDRPAAEVEVDVRCGGAEEAH